MDTNRNNEAESDTFETTQPDQDNPVKKEFKIGKLSNKEIKNDEHNRAEIENDELKNDEFGQGNF